MLSNPVLLAAVVLLVMLAVVTLLATRDTTLEWLARERRRLLEAGSPPPSPIRCARCGATHSEYWTARAPDGLAGTPGNPERVYLRPLCGECFPKGLPPTRSGAMERLLRSNALERLLHARRS